MIARAAFLSSVALQAMARLIARISPSMWFKLAIIAILIAIKQGAVL